MSQPGGPTSGRTGSALTPEPEVPWTAAPRVQSAPFAPLVQAVILITLGVYLYYLIYRWLYTINPDALTFSLVFFYAEVHGFVALALYFFQLWNPIRRESAPPPPGLSVDVFITTYDEDLELVRKTVIGALRMHYPHRTYILDDGHRAELAAMASALGCGYIAREERKHAKAGNLNHALARTTGEFVAVFDADHVPQPDFLVKTLGYFRDPRVAFVQTPHTYYNVDTFQFRLNVEKRKKWNEQDVFYRLMMPGRDHWNATFFAGTSGVLRRKALEEVGGFATETITEDVQTSLSIYRRGWKGVYHNEALALGLAAKDLSNYQTQKLRWAEGNVRALFASNPLWVRGLTLPQRLCFFATIFGWFIGLPKVIYFASPAVMLLTGWYPIAPFDADFVARYVVFLAVILIGFKVCSRGYGQLRYDEGYNMMNFFVLIKAVVKALLGLRSSFIVTGKGRAERVSPSDIAPQMALVVLCIAGIAWGAMSWFYAVNENTVAVAVGMFWAGVNGLLGVSVIAAVTAPYLKRSEFRFIGTVPVRYATVGGPSIEGLGICRDLNEFGTALAAFARLPLGEKLRLQLHLGPRALDAWGTILYMNPQQSREGVFVYGVRFEGMSREHRDIITQFCFSTIVPEFLQRFEGRQSLPMRALFWYYNRSRLRARAARKGVSLPIVIGTTPPLYAVTNDVSASGLSFLLYRRMDSGQRVRLDLVSALGQIEAEVEIRYSREIASERSYLVGARFVAMDPRGVEILGRLTEPRDRRQTSKA